MLVKQSCEKVGKRREVVGEGGRSGASLDPFGYHHPPLQTGTLISRKQLESWLIVAEAMLIASLHAYECYSKCDKERCGKSRREKSCASVSERARAGATRSVRRACAASVLVLVDPWVCCFPWLLTTIPPIITTHARTLHSPSLSHLKSQRTLARYHLFGHLHRGPLPLHPLSLLASPISRSALSTSLAPPPQLPAC